jgi:nitrite reductase/ring-hydroxylating ferredoxin subunit
VTRAADRLARVVDRLQRERRPPRFPAEPDEAAALYAAAALKAARPGADLPSRDFVADLEKKLAAEVARGDAPATRTPRLSRRTLLQVSGASAAAALAGVLVDRGLSRPEVRPPNKLVPKDGRWIPVVSTASLPEGRAMRFSTAAVEGFVVNHGGTVLAMSAICTHMGCVLRFNQPAQSLDCPCHGASFDLNGSPLHGGYLDSLPRLATRVRGGSIEVEVPRQA